MNELFISYHPGAMGNFIKMLISSGLKDYKLYKNHLLYKNETVSIIMDNGEILPYLNVSKFDKFLDTIFFNNFLNTWIDNPSEIFDTVCRLYNKQDNTDIEYIIGGHLHTTMHTRNSLEYAFKFMEQVGINRTLFITFDSEKEYDICKSYRYKKRPGVEDTFTLQQHVEIHESLLKNKRNCDMILQLKNIFNKEYLRNFLLINIDNWSDTYFNIIYDSYMNLQDYTLKV